MNFVFSTAMFRNSPTPGDIIEQFDVPIANSLEIVVHETVKWEFLPNIPNLSDINWYAGARILRDVRCLMFLNHIFVSQSQ